MNLIERNNDIQQVEILLKQFPATAILGPRQCGKTTLAKQIPYNHYFDLENPRDIARLENPQLTLEELKGLIVIDEVQKNPALFSLIRYLVDTNPEQKYLLLGSASLKLIKHSLETLAGRIAFYSLTGLQLLDIGKDLFQSHWLKGGFPRSFLTKTDEASILWRQNFITTFLERDIPQLGINIPSGVLRKFWMMLSHYHAQVINYSEFGRSFGASDVTVKKYLNILENTFMIRLLQPWYVNLGKRLIKRPKIYIRDSGIFHSLQAINNIDQLYFHNKLGASFEGYALECVIYSLKKNSEELFFWSTHSGAEVDLFWQQNGKNWGIEFKLQDAPKITKSMQIAINDLNLSKLWIIYPGKDSYTLSKNIHVLSVKDVPYDWKY